MSDRPWAVGEKAAAHLLHLAEQIDSEAAAAASPGQMLTLAGIAAQLRVLATIDPTAPARAAGAER